MENNLPETEKNGENQQEIIFTGVPANRKRLFVLTGIFAVLAVAQFLQLLGSRQGSLRTAVLSSASPRPSAIVFGYTPSPSAGSCTSPKGFSGDWQSFGGSAKASTVIANDCSSPSPTSFPSTSPTSTPSSFPTTFPTGTTSTPIPSVFPTPPSSTRTPGVSMDSGLMIKDKVSFFVEQIKNVFKTGEANAQDICLMPRSELAIGTFKVPQDRYDLNPKLPSGRYYKYIDNSITNPLKIIRASLEIPQGEALGYFKAPSIETNFIGFYKKVFSSTGYQGMRYYNYTKTTGEARNCNATTYATLSQFVAGKEPACVQPAASDFPVSYKGRTDIFYRPHAGPTADDPNGINQIKIVMDYYGTPGRSTYNPALVNAWTAHLNYVINHENHHKEILEQNIGSFEACINGITLPDSLSGLSGDNIATERVQDFVADQVKRCADPINSAQKTFDEQENAPGGQAFSIVCKLAQEIARAR